MENMMLLAAEQTPGYGVFEATGLLPGLGTAVGTAMRRVLLSSVPGAAVVWMRIDGVLHEFSTIPGVKEEVSEILLRVKRLILRVQDGDLHRMFLVAKGRDAVASDFIGDGAVEIINPQHRIATLAPDAVLSMEIWVQGGRDHAMGQTESREAEQMRRTVGMIYAEPVFSPVEKVSLEVEEREARDDLRLCVWTNGAVSPRQAVSWASQVLTSLSGRMITHEKQAQIVPNPKNRASSDLPALEELSLSTRAYNRLRRAHFQTVEEVLEKSKAELFAMSELGPKTITEVEVRLEALGLCLRADAS